MRRCHYPYGCTHRTTAGCAYSTFVCAYASSDSEHGADAGTPVSGPSHCSTPQAATMARTEGQAPRSPPSAAANQVLDK